MTDMYHYQWAGDVFNKQEYMQGCPDPLTSAKQMGAGESSQLVDRAL